MITLEQFISLSRDFNVIPLVKTLLADLHTPVSAYLAVREESVPSFLFESVEREEKVGRFSFIGTSPRISVRETHDGVTIFESTASKPVSGHILDVLEQLSAEHRMAPAEITDPLGYAGNSAEQLKGLTGGFVGYFGYDAVRYLESIRLPKTGDSTPDESRFDLFDSVIRFDHLQQSISIIHNVFIGPGADLKVLYELGRKRLEALELRLKRTPFGAQHFSYRPADAPDPAERERYQASVGRARQYIHEGDIFQVVLSRRQRFEYSGDLFAVYRALRVVNPSPYLFYVDFGRTKLVGSSPEVLVRVQDGTVELLPIAGTRPRGQNEAEDLRLEEELLNDQKELAEHVMLVDLGRNDVGHVSEYGTVEVPVLKRVDRYSHVMHIVSHVRGRLKEHATSVKALKSCFPAGTVSGAPKVRAMEIISELEGEPRGLYAGAVGYIGLDGSLDTCIAIRTIFACDNTLTIQAGAGIVADSVPESEYNETLNKSRALVSAMDLAQKSFGGPNGGFVKEPRQ